MQGIIKLFDEKSDHAHFHTGIDFFSHMFTNIQVQDFSELENSLPNHEAFVNFSRFLNGMLLDENSTSDNPTTGL